MEAGSKGRKLHLWFVCCLCLCALPAGKWLIFGDAVPRLRLVEEVDCVSGGKPAAVCRTVNPTVQEVRLGQGPCTDMALTCEFAVAAP